MKTNINDELKYMATEGSHLAYEAKGKLYNGWTDDCDITPFVYEFSKLIVLKCAEIASEFSSNKLGIHPDLTWDDLSISDKSVVIITGHQISKAILEHFGSV